MLATKAKYSGLYYCEVAGNASTKNVPATRHEVRTFSGTWGWRDVSATLDHRRASLP